MEFVGPTRIAFLLSREPDWLRLRAEADDGGFEGRYLTIGNVPFALGREVGRGEEAIVFELIDLRSGQFSHVVKICRHRAGTEAYQRWAVPIRFQRNVGSAMPDIELVPSSLIPVPGGLVKIQPYLPPNPDTDWSSAGPIEPVMTAYAKSPDQAIRLLDELLSKHGEQAVFLEMKGRIALAAGSLDDAAACLSRAVAVYMATGSSLRYAAVLFLAVVLDDIYQRDHSNGRLETSIKLENGAVLRNTFFSSAEDAARDDAFQDKSLFTLLEVMADLPYFVGGLNLIRELVQFDYPRSTTWLLQRAVALIDPQNPLLEDEERGVAGTDGEHGPQPISTSDGAPATEPAGGFPDSVRAGLAAFDAVYRPDPETARNAHARIDSALLDFRRGRLVDAEANLREARTIAPHATEPIIALAAFLSQTSRDAEAADVLRQGIETVISAPSLRLLLGRHLLKTGDLDGAERSLLMARPLLPEYHDVIDTSFDEISYRRKVS